MDDQAFESLFTATRGPLLGYLRRTAGNAALAEDLLQECYIRLLERPPRARDHAALRAWLFTTATRLLCDHWRRERHRGWLRWARPWAADDEDDLAAPDPACTVPRPDRTVSAREVVALAFDDLSPRQRSLLWLAHVEGFDHAELARALGLSRGSVRVLLHRARRRMEERLRTMGVEDSTT